MTNPDITEKILWQSKSSLWFWMRSIVAIILFIAASGALYLRHLIPPLNTLVGLVPQDATVLLSFLPLVTATLFLARLQISRISAGRFRITSKRVIERRGLASNRTNELSIEDIKGINMQQSFLYRLLGVGTLEIVSGASRVQHIRFDRIHHPAAVSELIQRLREERI